MKLRGVPQGTDSPTPCTLTLADAVSAASSRTWPSSSRNSAEGHRERAARGAERSSCRTSSGSVRQSEQNLSTAAFGFHVPGPADRHRSVRRVRRAAGAVDAALRRPRHRRPARRQRARARRPGRRPRRPRNDRARGRHAVSAGRRRTPRGSNRRRRRSRPPRRWSALPTISAPLASSPASTSCASRCSCSRRGHGSSSRRTPSRSASCHWRGPSACPAARCSRGRRHHLHRGAADDDRAGGRGGGARLARISRPPRRASRRRGSREQAEAAARCRACTSTPTSARSAATRRTLERTYTVAATVRVPIFEGGETRARVQRAEAELRNREAELADLTGGIRYDVSAALLDMQGRRRRRRGRGQRARRCRGRSWTRRRIASAPASPARSSWFRRRSRWRPPASSTSPASTRTRWPRARLTRAIGEVEQRFVALVGGEQ